MPAVGPVKMRTSVGTDVLTDPLCYAARSRARSRARSGRNAQTPPPCTMRRVRGSGATPSVVVDNPPASALDTVRKGRGGNLPFAWRTQPQGTPHPPPTEGWIHPRPPHPPRWLQPNNQIRPCTMRAAVPRNRDVANLTTQAQCAMAAAGICAMPFKSSPRRRTKRGAAQAPATCIAKRSALLNDLLQPSVPNRHFSPRATSVCG